MGLKMAEVLRENAVADTLYIITFGPDICQYAKFAKRPLQNTPFCPISTSDSNFNPRNTQCIPVVKIFPFLELEQK